MYIRQRYHAYIEYTFCICIISRWFGIFGDFRSAKTSSIGFVCMYENNLCKFNLPTYIVASASSWPIRLAVLLLFWRYQKTLADNCSQLDFCHFVVKKVLYFPAPPPKKTIRTNTINNLSACLNFEVISLLCRGRIPSICLFSATPKRKNQMS